MKMVQLLPAFAAALGRPEKTVKEAVRQLRVAGFIPGAGQGGGAAPDATVADVAKVIMALMASDKPLQAPASLERCLGMVGKISAIRPSGERVEKPEAVPLIGMLQGCLKDMVEKPASAEQFLSAKVMIARPWPYARVRMQHENGVPIEGEFHHRDAFCASPDEAPQKLAELQRRWGYAPGFVEWTELDLKSLMIVADALAGRLTPDELGRRTVPPAELLQGTLPPEGAVPWN